MFNRIWQNIGLKRDGVAQTLLYGHFAEILFNAFKYADHAAVDFLCLEFDELQQNDQRYLTITWSNPVSDNRLSGMGSSQGLEAIKEDLSQLNGQHATAPNLVYWVENSCFYVRLFYQTDLLWKQAMPELDIGGLLLKN